MSGRWRGAGIALILAVSAFIVGMGAAPAVGVVQPPHASAGAVSFLGTAQTPSPDWTPEELQAMPSTGVPDQEPGIGVPGATFVGPASLQSTDDPLGTATIFVSLDPSNQTSLTELLVNLSDPNSPDYHHYLSHAQFDSTFGSDATVYSSLASYLQSYGVTYLTTHPDRLSIGFRATELQIAAIFHTSLGAYLSSSGQPYFAPISPPISLRL